MMNTKKLLIALLFGVFSASSFAANISESTATDSTQDAPQAIAAGASASGGGGGYNSPSRFKSMYAGASANLSWSQGNACLSSSTVASTNALTGLTGNLTVTSSCSKVGTNYGFSGTFIVSPDGSTAQLSGSRNISLTADMANMRYVGTDPCGTQVLVKPNMDGTVNVTGCTSSNTYRFNGSGKLN